MSDFDLLEGPDGPPADSMQELARDELEEIIEGSRERIYFSRQLEVRLEDSYFHWITNRAIRELEGEGLIQREEQQLQGGSTIMLLWHKSYRYYKRQAKKLVGLVEEYADPNIGAALGLHGEALVLEGFAKHEFVLKGREAREYQGREWTQTGHDLDFIFERDRVGYGVEVKNKLGYMEQKEFRAKIQLCRHLGIKPVIVARMLPRTWIYELQRAGGFALILKYQLYPWSHRVLAKRVAEELELPVDAPRALADGTMQRFVNWHDRNL